MRLHSVHIEQVRQFRRPFTLDNLQPGINVIHGPNESGKSTLVRAIRAAFFERHRSKAIEDLIPWGDSGASPRIELVFEHGDRRWQLTKQFLKGKRCDLRVASETFSGEEAEEKLADMLGYQFAKKGASKEEHWGIPGLLWVEQGAGQDIEQAVVHASDHLKTALNSLVGEVASSGGDEIIQAVTAQRAELLTTTGKPRGDYARLDVERDELEARLAELDERIRHYQSRVDRLGALRDAHNQAEQERPWDRARDNLKHVEARFREIEALQQQQHRDNETLRELLRKLELLQQSREQFQQQLRKLEQRESEYRRAEKALQEEQARIPVLNTALEAARSEYDIARKAVEKARVADQRQRLQRDIAQREEELKLLGESVRQAAEYRARLDEARTAKQQNLIDARGVQQLRNTQRRLEEEFIRSEAIATRLGWRLEPGKTLNLNGKSLEKEGKENLLEHTTLDIPGVGTLDITPGGEDLGRVRRQIRRLEGELADLLARLGVESVAAAEERLARYQAAEGQIERVDELLKSLAPNGIERLENQQAELRTELDNHRRELEAVPAQGDGEPVKSLATAETDLASAENRLNEAEQAFRRHETAILKATHALDSARREWEQLKAELTAPEREKQSQELDRDIATEKKRQHGLEETLARRKVSIDEARPDLLQQDIQRYSATIEQLEKAHQGRALEIRELRGRLEASGAEGLEEQRNELAAELEHANRRYEELDRRARALDLLLDLLQTKRQILTKRLQAPLQKHLDRYLGLLFPRATLEVDEQLKPGTFSRDNELGEIKELSFGAREQMGLISRLAYADLLLEAGRPTLVILDDTLVHSDTGRLEAMKRILFDASNRHQILLFTCHPERWHDLGVLPLDLQATKEQGANTGTD